MNLAEMKEQIDELVERFGEDKAEEIEVTIGYQPSWPLESNLAGIVENSAEQAAYFSDDEDESDEEEENSDIPDRIVFLAGGSDRGYGSKWWWNAI